jgi:hypothetical protein
VSAALWTVRPAVSRECHACREIKAHVPEPFWKIVMMYAWPAHPSDPAQAGAAPRQLGQKPLHRKTEFFWTRGRLFDHGIATVLYEMCLMAKIATVTEAWPISCFWMKGFPCIEVWCK